jgi:hypothetical protein
MPSHIRRRRTGGWQKGGAVIVDRTSRFGNPFHIVDGLVVQAPDGESWNGRQWTCSTPPAARQHAARLTPTGSTVLAPTQHRPPTGLDRRRVLTALPELRGLNLASYAASTSPAPARYPHPASPTTATRLSCRRARTWRSQADDHHQPHRYAAGH